MDIYKILSLDGGGSWAILQALALEKIFKEKYPEREIRGHEILKHFDFVVANSGGSLILAALCCDWSITNIKEVFLDGESLQKVFSPIKKRQKYFPFNLLRALGITTFGTRYSTTEKREALESLLKFKDGNRLGSLNISQIPEIIGKPSLRIMVCTFDIPNKRAKLFKSWNTKDNPLDEISLVKAVHGSSNAPINYFDFPAVFSPKDSKRRYYLWDGALGGFNNPVSAAVTESLANGNDRSKIRVLSLGTGNKVATDSEIEHFHIEYYSTLIGHSFWKKLGLGRSFVGFRFFEQTIKNLSQSILFEPQLWSNYSTYVTLTAPDMNSKEQLVKFIRLSPQLFSETSNEELKDLVRKLIGLDMDITSTEEITLLFDCFKAWERGKISNEPIHWELDLEREYRPIHGHTSFREGLRDLQEWL